mgnify:CR=1 FL=1
MVGSITSLNASVAAAILMYEVYNQRNPKNKSILKIGFFNVFFTLPYYNEFR